MPLLARRMSLLATIVSLAVAMDLKSAWANPIVPAADGTGTVVTVNGHQFDISGGQLSGDGANLFHSFKQLGLDEGQIANFLSKPEIRNILSRVVGGSPSIINGSIQVMGGRTNLFLINPAGILFGPNASLNVPADFTAIAATGVQFGDNWFSATGPNDYEVLVGAPNAFAFSTAQPGAVFNAGSLSVNPAQNLTLIGGTVVNTGQLSAPGGQITLAAVPGESLVRISQPNMVLNLEIQPLVNAGTQPNDWSLPATGLPELLTGGNADHAQGVTINSEGQLLLTGSGLRLDRTQNTLIASGTVNVADTTPDGSGGRALLLGERVATIGAEIDASGSRGGGTVLIGGDYQGQGTLPTALQTFISRDSTIEANALHSGNGGQVIVWADRSTRFLGKVNARGAGETGNGGFVEVSGKQDLLFDGLVDVGASNGNIGTLLLDPVNITISAAADTAGVAAALPDIFAADFLGMDININVATLAAQTANVILQATNNITFSNAVMMLNAGVGLTAQAGNNIAVNADITTMGGDVNFNATGAIALNNATIATNGGNFTAMGTGTAVDSIGINLINSTINAGTGTINLTGNGGTTGNLNIGIRLFNGSTVQSTGTGTITLTGTSGVIGADQNHGILIEGAGSRIASVDGAINLMGSGSGTTDSNAGILLVSGGQVESTGLGDITLTGNGNGSDSNPGIEVSLAGSAIRSADGDIDLTGTSTGMNNDNRGIRIVTGAVLEATGSGNIDLTGTGAGMMPGIEVDSATIDLTAGGGDLTFTADEILFRAGSIIRGTGIVTLQPLDPTLDIAVSATSDMPSRLDLQASELGLLQDGFSDIFIGASNSSGAIILESNLTFSDPLSIRSPTIPGSINTSGSSLMGTDNGSLDLAARTVIAGVIDLTGTTVPENIAILGDEIDLTGTVQGNGTVTLRPLDLTQDIEVANTSATAALDLTVADLIQLQDGFTQITIGRNSNTGTVSLNPFSFQDPVRIAGGSTLVGANQNTTWTLTGADAGTLSGFNETLTFANIENLTGGSSSDSFQFSNPASSISGNIDGVGVTDTLDYSGYTGGDVTVTLGTNIPGTATAVGGTISSIESVIGNSASNNTLVGEDANNTWNITGINSGNINGTVSFSNIQNLTGGNADDTFAWMGSTGQISGNIDGSSGFDRLDYSAYTGGPVAVTLGTTTLGTATAVGGTIFNIEEGESSSSDDGGSLPGGDGGSLPGGDGGLVDPLAAGISIPGELILAIEPGGVVPRDNTLAASVTADDGSLLRLADRNKIGQLFEEGNVSEAVALLDCSFSGEYNGYLKGKRDRKQLQCTAIPEKLRAIATISGTQPAIIYTFVETDQLHLVLITAEGIPIHRKIPAADRETLLKTVSEFQGQIADITKRRTTSYLASAQQLYQWIVTPLAADLDRLNIDTLIFAMDTGLRRLPLAALHNGQQFLVEQYNLSLIPSLYLTDTRYKKLTPDAVEVLAMGMSRDFPNNQQPLPGVPVEISTIVGPLWPGETFLNHDFTLKNIKQKRRAKPFRIVHLATHGRFLPGAANNSFLQLWNDKLELQSISQLGWDNPPVELLVLSACHTAVGNEEIELGFAGLALKTGVKSALASLWYVNDTATLGLITGFYEQLRKSPIKATALRQAQIAMLHGQVRLESGKMVGATQQKIALPPELATLSDRTFVHPYYWAGFTMIGNPW